MSVPSFRSFVALGGFHEWCGESLVVCVQVVLICVHRNISPRIIAAHSILLVNNVSPSGQETVMPTKQPSNTTYPLHGRE